MTTTFKYIYKFYKAYGLEWARALPSGLDSSRVLLPLIFLYLIAYLCSLGLPATSCDDLCNKFVHLSAYKERFHEP